MLVELFFALLVAGGSAAVVLWVFAVKTGFDVVKASRAGGTPAGPSTFARLVAWPFGARQLSGVATDKATLLNKMMVGFFAAILVVAGSAAVYSNLTFVPPPAQTVQ
ncbi:MAG: hypothetical protein K0R27_4002 [Xanthobacteraceae bacterium]|jgi:hypothetical protein|nr:hypothetical protein [Xanthobacteraceae bacterium]